MWKCPVCETEYGDVTVCPKCGFDGSCDYERYPTAFTVRNAKSTRALRREWEQKQAPRVDGGNINREIVITPEQAAQGCQITAGYFGGKRVEVTIPANWKDGGLLRCAEQGYPGKNGGKNGDLILTVRVQQPEPAQQAKQTQQQAQKPKQAQPAPAKAPAAKKALWPLIVFLLIALGAGILLYSSNSKDGVSYNSKSNSVSIKLTDKKLIRTGQLKYAEKLLDKYQCSQLNIDGLEAGQTDTSLMDWVGKQTHITSLTLYGCYVNDLTPLAKLTLLTDLDLSYNQISNLTPLYRLTQLTALDLSFNEIRDLKPLFGLKQLTELDLYFNQIDNLAPLSGLTRLEKLYVSRNQISDLTPLAGMTKLRSLRIVTNQVSSLAGLENLTKLEDIYAAGNPLTDTSALEVSGRMSALRTD